MRIFTPNANETFRLFHRLAFEEQVRTARLTSYPDGVLIGAKRFDSEVIVMIPTRGRPESFKKAYESVVATSDASVFAFVDPDQTEMYQHLSELPRLMIMTGKRYGPVHALNGMWRTAQAEARDYLPNARIWTYMTDDCTVGPSGWDKWLIKTIDSYPGRLVVISGEHAGADYVNFVSLSNEMVNAIGWFALPNVFAWVWDTALELVGDATAIHYAKSNELSFHHVHQVTHDSVATPKEDCWNFIMWCITERKRIVESVRAAIAKAKEGHAESLEGPLPLR